jgi:hypothetical protein
MLNRIYLDPKMVPQHLRGSYNGKQFKAVVCTEHTIPADAGTWSGGSRDTYTAINFETGQQVTVSDHYSAPWDSSRKDRRVKLEPGFCLVEHSMFCGKDMGLTFYIHPDNATKMLPVAVTLTPTECLVLNATKSLKSSYAGRDRYDNARGDYSLEQCLEGEPYPTRDRWDIAKQALINRGLLNKAGAITVNGRNALSK